MRPVLAVVSLGVIAATLFDAFEAMLLPRRVTRGFRYTPLFYRYTWTPWARLSGLIALPKRREAFLSVYGPLSILILFLSWALGLIVGFAALHWSLRTPLSAVGEGAGLGTYLYFSGVTFFTLGYGDLTPEGPLGRFLAVLETGVGFGFLAVVISYLPVLFQAFSAREVTISLLDARAGSPPTAAQLLLRQASSQDRALLNRMFEEWERWAAELLASHVSFPVLAFYRSQHDNESWLAALTLILDASAYVVASMKRSEPLQARLTFAMARHAAVDLAQVFHVPPITPAADRFPEAARLKLREALQAQGVDLRADDAVVAKLDELRGTYEPFVNALALYLRLKLPPFYSDTPPVDNWQTSAWMRRMSGLGTLVPADPRDDHDD